MDALIFELSILFHWSVCLTCATTMQFLIWKLCSIFWNKVTWCLQLHFFSELLWLFLSCDTIWILDFFFCFCEKCHWILIKIILNFQVTLDNRHCNSLSFSSSQLSCRIISLTSNSPGHAHFQVHNHSEVKNYRLPSTPLKLKTRRISRLNVSTHSIKNNELSK